jgi:tetratricopeptide (TPR) repeat protein
MTSSENKLQPYWLPEATSVLLFLGVLSNIVVQSLRRVSDSDHWHHLRAGEHLFNTGRILEQFNFSALHPEQTYINHEWLYQAVVYLIDHYSGEIGLVGLQITLCVLAFFLVWRTSKLHVRTPAVEALILLLVVMCVSHRLALRPQHFSYVFLVLNFYVLHRYEQGDHRWLWLSVLVMPFWANMHAECIWGVIVPVTFFAGELLHRPWRDPKAWNHYKRGLIPASCAALAALLNPHGIMTLVWPFTVMGEMGSNVEELQASIDPRYRPFWLLFTLTCLSIVMLRRQIRWSWVGLLGGFGLVAWTANRGIPHFAFLATPFVVRGIVVFFQRLPSFVWVRFAARLMIVFTAFLMAFSVVTNRAYFNKYDNVDYPEAAVRLLTSENIKGNVFVEHLWGGFVLWNGRPDLAPFMDGRYYEKRDFDWYYSAKAGLPVWQSVFKHTNISIAIVKYDFQQPADLADALHNHPDWTLVFFDDKSLVFLRNNFSHEAAISRLKIEGYFPKTQLTWMFEGASRQDIEKQLRQANRLVEGAPRSAKARIYRASAAFSSGNFKLAANDFGLAIDYIPLPNAWLYFQAARAELAIGGIEQAKNHLKEVVRLAPEFAEARNLLNGLGSEGESSGLEQN